ncbi:MAG: hypothetical protein M0Z40_15000 [Actinomycetota bacterium]|nr:hypothetical protein [Actinomycetota bacterium]
MPPLTVPPLPGVGVLGVVVPDGPTWIGGGPSPAVPEPDVAEPDVVEPPVPEVDVCELGVVAPVVAAAAGALGLVAVGEAVRAAVSTTAVALAAVPLRLEDAVWCPAVPRARTANTTPAARRIGCRGRQAGRRRISPRRRGRRGWTR